MQKTRIAAPSERVWAVVMDIPQAARCLPGVAGVTAAAPGEFKATLLAQVGPVRLVLDGDVSVVSRDDAAHRASLRATAKDTRLGGTIRASVDVGVLDAAGGCELRIATDVEVAGRIGEFGQAVMQRKSAQLLQQFAQCLGRVATR